MAEATRQPSLPSCRHLPARHEKTNDATTMMTAFSGILPWFTWARREYVFPALRGISERSENDHGHSGAGEGPQGLRAQLCAAPCRGWADGRDGIARNGEPPVQVAIRTTSSLSGRWLRTRRAASARRGTQLLQSSLSMSAGGTPGGFGLRIRLPTRSQG